MVIPVKYTQRGPDLTGAGSDSDEGDTLPPIRNAIRKETFDPVPYMTILDQCNESTAKEMLGEFTATPILASWRGFLHAMNALKIFNRPDRLPIFIQALKLGRTASPNSIKVLDLLSWDMTSDSPFKDPLPKYVREALQIEYDHQPDQLNRYAKKHVLKLEDAWVAEYIREKERIEKDPNLTKADKENLLASFEDQQTQSFAKVAKIADEEKASILKDGVAHADRMFDALVIKCCRENTPHADDLKV